MFKAALTTIALCAATVASSQGLDANAYYRLEPAGAPGQLSLDVINNEHNTLMLAPSGDFSGQYWRFTSAGGGKYRLTTMFRGDGMCLDVQNGGPANNELMLAPCRNASGQLWTLRPTPNGVRMTSDFRGANQCADVAQGAQNARHNWGGLQACSEGRDGSQVWRIVGTGRTAN